MRIIVCIKPVPEPRYLNQAAGGSNSKTLNREGIPFTVNPLDKHAMEAALKLRDEYGGEVIAMSMAPPNAANVLRELLAMGADYAVLLTDPGFAGSDTLATSNILSAGVKEIGEFDVILCGNESIDSGTSSVSAQLAEFLDVPNLMSVRKIERSDTGSYIIQSRMEKGSMLVEVESPMVLSVVRDLNEPRQITLMNILDAEKKEVRIWNKENLSIDEKCIGLNGSPTQMGEPLKQEIKMRAEMINGSVEEQAKELASRLNRLGLI